VEGRKAGIARKEVEEGEEGKEGEEAEEGKEGKEAEEDEDGGMARRRDPSLKEVPTDPATIWARSVGNGVQQQFVRDCW